MDCRQIPLKILISLGATVFAGIIILGFNPRHSLLTNKVSRLADGSGIRFRKYGIAATKPFDPAADLTVFPGDPEVNPEVSPMNDPVTQEPGQPAGFSVEIAFTSEHWRKNGFGILFMLHDGDDGSQLLMGQWRSHIIVMNGNDYDYRRKAPRISADIAGMSAEPVLATVTTGNGRTRLYLNGRCVIEKKNMTLTIPDARPMRLVMGNSVYGNTSWEGDIYGFAVYPYPLTAADVLNHYGGWLKTRDFSFAPVKAPSLLYLFDEAPGGVALDRSVRHHDLEIPKRMIVFKRQILAFSPDDLRFSRDVIQDVAFNFAGFVPFGLLAAAILSRFQGAYERHAVVVAVLMGFAVSIAIEVAQAWIPSRSSSLLDLVMNTAGTGSGAAVCGMLCRK